MKKSIQMKIWFLAVLMTGLGWLHPLGAQVDAEIVDPPISTNTVATDTNTAVPDVEPVLEVESNEKRSRPRPRDVVVFGRNVVVKAGEEVGDVVVIGGSATVHGKVHGSVVAIMGNVTLNNESKDAIAVMGDVKIGTNGSVHGDVVAVLGAVKLASGSKVRGDVVGMGGDVDREEGSSVIGDTVGFAGFSWLNDWLRECVFKLRPLAPGLRWLWVMTATFFLLSLLVAVAFRRPVNACVDEIKNRPATTFLIGLLSKFLIPLVLLILAATGVGVIVVPFLMAALFIAALIGKVAFLAFIGQQIVRRPDENGGSKVFQFVVGWVIITALYLVPFIGLVVWSIVGLFALGAAVLSIFGRVRRETPKPLPASGQPPIGQTAAAATAAFAQTAMPASAPSPDAGSATVASAAAVPIQPVVPDTLALPRATLWERTGAAFLDLILIGMTGHFAGPCILLVALAYFAGMWAWRGTTIGGIVLNLKVVRYDGQPMSFLVALIRGLAAMFSVVVLFLGFLWIAWDDEKQGWHDKIAGTLVVRQRRGTPLLVL